MSTQQAPVKTGLLDFFRTSTGNQFVIPVYQRNYTWTANKEVNGSFIVYKYIPKVYEIIKSKGINLVDDIFNEIENK